MVDSCLPSLFPDSPRIIYSRNPLVEVICQLRFPSILRITTEPPVTFQEKIRGEYPLLTERSPESDIEIPPGVPASVAETIMKALPRRKLVGFDFVSADEKWKVSLTKEFLALTTSKYTRWEDFRQHLEGPLSALIEVYSPAFCTRVGLRYQDLVQRSKLGLAATTPWAQLLRGHIAGVLAPSELATTIEEHQCQTLIKLPAYGGKVRMRHGIVQTVDTNEECFLIDSDFYTQERTKLTDVDGILGYFNRQSGRLFRWCIEDRLHQAMEPGPVVATSA